MPSLIQQDIVRFDVPTDRISSRMSAGCEQRRRKERELTDERFLSYVNLPKPTPFPPRKTSRSLLSLIRVDPNEILNPLPTSDPTP